MANRQPIELLLVCAPLRHSLIHQRDETGIVRWLQYVNHLVDDHVLEAFAWFLREVGVKANAAS